MQLPDCLQGLDVVGLDFETFYDSKTFSLKRDDMSTSLYVRDDRFKTHTVGLRKPRWKQAKWYGPNRLAQELDKIDWSRTALLCHHTHFDGLILSHHFGHVPAFYLDTLSMARALHGNDIDSKLDTVAQFYGRGNKLPDVLGQLDGVREPSKELLQRLGEYNAVDVDIMWDVFWDMLEADYPDDELRLIDLTVSLFTEPVLEVDRDLAEAERAKWRKRKDDLLQEVIHYDKRALQAVYDVIENAEERLSQGKNPRKSYNEHLSYNELISKTLKSNERYAEMLRAFDVSPPTKPSPSDPSKRVYAFAKNDLDFQALQAHPEEKVRKLVEARQVAQSNINETRAQGLLNRSGDGMKLPVYLNYCGAHTMRWSGGDRVNIQNFPDPAKGTDSRLRECLTAPRGMHIVVVDSAQIEARVVAWLFGQDDALEAFADPKRDPYCEFASDLYQYPITKDDNPTERFVGKVCKLGLGFGMGPPKLQYTLATGAMGPPLWLEFETCQQGVDLFRKENYRITLGWRQLQKLIGSCLISGAATEYGGILGFEREQIHMPNGLPLRYPNIRAKSDDNDRIQYFYKQRRNEWSKIYGGLLTENCLAEGTLVLTDRGWVPIEQVQDTDLVHDGVEWVTHGGTFYKSVQPCVTVDGVHMTGDHEVLTDEGWQAASQNPRPYRPDLRGADRATTDRQRRQEETLVMPLRMRHRDRARRGRAEETPLSQLRLSYTAAADKAQEPRHDQSSGLRRLAFYARSMSVTVASGLAQLRRARDHSLQALATLRDVLGRYGTFVPAGPDPRTSQQQSGVLPSELLLGKSDYSSWQQAQFTPDRHPQGASPDWQRPYDAVLPLEERPVYDIVNAGPRRRFVVAGDEGPFVVHNCVQCLARIVLGLQALWIGQHYRIISLTHDEVIFLAPKSKADEALEFGLECLRVLPESWLEGLPLDSEGGHARVYSK